MLVDFALFLRQWRKVMSPASIGFLGIAIMLVLFATRMPVAFVMGVVGFVGFSVLTSVQGGLNMVSRSMYEVFVSYDLTTIPLFILMGQLAFNAGISQASLCHGLSFLRAHPRRTGHGHGLGLHRLWRGVRIEPSHGRDHGHGGHSGDEALRLPGPPGRGPWPRAEGWAWSCRRAWCSSSTGC
jgi:hypothetical protein